MVFECKRRTSDVELKINVYGIRAHSDITEENTICFQNFCFGGLAKTRKIAVMMKVISSYAPKVLFAFG
jgi:hypothetical protein